MRAERPLLLVGSQALACASEARDIAAAVHHLELPVYLSGMARGLLGRLSAIQLRHRRREALRESDCVVLAGVPCDFRLDYGRHIRRGATVIAANRSREEARMNRRPDILALGDAGRFLRSLAGATTAGDNRSAWLGTLRSRDEEREREIERTAAIAGDHVNPIALCRAIDAAAASDATFVADGGDFVATAAYTVRPRAPLQWLDPGVFGTLGVGAGFALGAKLCRPDDEVWILWGDGACGYGLVEYDTFVRHGGGGGGGGECAGGGEATRHQPKPLPRGPPTGVPGAGEPFGAGAAPGLRGRAGGGARARPRPAAARGGAATPVNAWLDPRPCFAKD